MCVFQFFLPVVLRLEKLELLLDAVQRLRDGELEGLARGLVRRLITHKHTKYAVIKMIVPYYESYCEHLVCLALSSGPCHVNNL